MRLDYWWLDAEPRSGALNMAIDSALLRHAAATGNGFLRLYRWDPFCLSFGRHEPAARRYDRDTIEREAISVVRRPTGGRGVWHARELTYAVALPAAGAGALRDVYREIHGTLAVALRCLGAEASLAPTGRTPALDAGACFAAPVGGEVLVQGRKVVGSAQLREDGGILQHGSLLLQDDQALVDRLLGRIPPEAERAAAAAPLSGLVGRTIGFDEAAEAVLTAGGAAWGNRWRRFEPGALLAAASRDSRFCSADWTWRR